MKSIFSLLSLFLSCLLTLSSCGPFATITDANMSQNDKPKYTHTIINASQVDNEQALVIAGWTNSNHIPLKNAYRDRLSGKADGFISKISTDGDLLWSTYFGGTGTELIHNMYITSQNQVWITGFSDSNDMNTTLVSSESKEESWFYYIAKFTPDGQNVETLRYDLPVPYFFKDYVKIVSLSETHFLIVATVPDDLQGKEMRTKLPIINPLIENQEGNLYIYFASIEGQVISSGFYGGIPNQRKDEIFQATINPEHKQVYLTGRTFSADFPVYNAIQEKLSKNGESDAYVFCFDFLGNLQWSTYLGGSKGDIGVSILFNKEDEVLISGRTESENFPIVSPQAFIKEQISYKPDYRRGYSFLAIFSRNGKLLSSTYLRETLPVSSYSFNSMNEHGSISFSGYGIIFDLDKEFRSVNEYQKGPLGKNDSSETVARSNLIGSINSKGEYTFFTFYGGIGLIAETEHNSLFIVNKALINSKNHLFVLGRSRNLAPEILDHIELDPAVFNTQDTIAFVSIFDNDGNFKKMLLWGIENKSD